MPHVLPCLQEKEALGRVEDLVQEAREETDTRLQQHWPGLIQGKVRNRSFDLSALL